jgi:tRNA A37 threonylcarbamoyladenosine biosynthesis protein TsaE
VLAPKPVISFEARAFSFGLIILAIEYSAYENETIQSIVSYLNMETSGALMLSGEWGCGKTYFIKNKFIQMMMYK